MPSPSPTLVLDTGATGHFATPAAIHDNLQPTHQGVRVKMPNADVIQATHTGTLPVPALAQLPQTATKAHVIPTLHHSLVSIGVLCDHGCQAVFDAKHAYIKHNNRILIKGNRTANGLWTIMPSFTNKQQQHINLVTKAGAKLTTSILEHLRFLHAACFSPVPSTWEQAVNNNNFVTWPAVTIKNIRKFLKKSPATVKGHLDQLRQNIHSTAPSTITKHHWHRRAQRL